ncbi:LysR family transcriptional regulator [Roseomonas hellenica]|uniref:LysR family transcriptional regulator n=1 Tax=Plastoroseomonas hellenica TaxID=2687306 RepID=A0ABS5ERZ0_9PROT|nr:LysR substrate-binding domain-containing protein [Plastoroseomonas hellenica]MBR0663067.1 LysR family transcriptional regulator [Plastoroseomonas hellenica]
MPNRSRLPLIAFRAFEAVARLGGVRRAADELRVTEGAVSQQLRALEAALGVPLVWRNANRRLTLTEQGAGLLSNLTAAFDLMEHGVREVEAARSSRRLRVRVLPTLAIRWLIPRLGGFYQRHGDVDIEVSTAAERETVLGPEDDFVARQGRGGWPGVRAEPLFQDAFLPVCAPAAAKALRAPKALAKATRLHSMLRPDAWRIWLEAKGMTEAVEPEVGLRFANAALAYQASIEGLGVAMAQHAYVEADLRDGRLVAPWPDTVGTTEGYYLLCAEEKAELPKHKAFLAWIRDCVGGTAGIRPRQG